MGTLGSHARANNSYVWNKDNSEWVPKRQAKAPYRIHSLPSTPRTRIIPEDELPYYEDSSSSFIEDDPVILGDPPHRQPSSSTSSAVHIEELPSDKIDTPRSGKGNILSTFWDYLTLFW